MTIWTDLLYLDTCIIVVLCRICVFSVGSRRDFYGGNTCLEVGGKVGMNEGGGYFFTKLSLMVFM